MSSDKASIRLAKVVSERGADETLQLLEEHGANVGELSPEAEGKLKAKIRNHILVLVIIIDLMLYVCPSAFCGREAFYSHGCGPGDRLTSRLCPMQPSWAYTRRLG